MMKNKTCYLLIPSLIIYLSISSCNQIKKDYSLKTEDYIKLGMPDHSKKWTGDDYSEANITLSTLQMEAPLSLPRKNSRKSGEMFNRIVNEENISFVYDTAIPLKVRAFLIQHYPRIIGEVENIYSFEEKGKPVYKEELLDIKIFELTIHDKMLELAKIINESDDETLAGFKDGMKMVQYNYLKLIPRLMTELVKTDQYSEDDRIRLSKALTGSIMNSSYWLSASDKNTLKSGLTASSENCKSTIIKNNLMECSEALN
ncbi:MAG TPA: hypothetical protein VMV47_04220 [Bacteroidales bacterium]|nr:hypothetical protein [Bacteroidales bacterium]